MCFLWVSVMVNDHWSWSYSSIQEVFVALHWMQFVAVVDKLTFCLFADCFGGGFVELYLMPEIKFTTRVQPSTAVEQNYQQRANKVIATSTNPPSEKCTEI